LIAPRITRLLSASVFAIGISLTTIGVAQATPTPQLGSWYEVSNPLINSQECLDAPAPNGTFGSPVGIKLQIWHCHGYDSDGLVQRWYFNTGPNTPGVYTVENGRSLACAQSSFSAGDSVAENICGSDRDSWVMLPSPFGSDYFLLQNVGTQLCMAQANTSASNGTRIIVKSCASGDITEQWRLG
jgi:hypothetical protein